MLLDALARRISDLYKDAIGSAPRDLGEAIRDPRGAGLDTCRSMCPLWGLVCARTTQRHVDFAIHFLVYLPCNNMTDSPPYLANI